MLFLFFVAFVFSYDHMDVCDKSGWWGASDYNVGCITGCSKCDSNTKCTTCSFGYVLSGTAPNSCTKCAEGCQKCLLATKDTACTQCNTDYVQTGSTACLSCTKAVGTSTGWDANGKTCTATSATKVDLSACKDGYKVCKPTTGDDKCTKCDDNASTCLVTAGACTVITGTTCKTGWIQDVDVKETCLSCTTTPVAKGGDANAVKCTAGATTVVVVSECKDKWAVCKKTSDTHKKCFECTDANAKTCAITSDATCTVMESTTCKDGWIQDFAVKKTCLSCSATSVANGGDPNASSCTSGVTLKVVVTGCKDGFGMRTESSTVRKCVACTTGTNSDPKAKTCTVTAAGAITKVTDCVEDWEYNSDDSKCYKCTTTKYTPPVIDVSSAGIVAFSAGVFGALFMF